jgi:hypothetical protein
MAGSLGPLTISEPREANGTAPRHVTFRIASARLAEFLAAE